MDRFKAYVGAVVAALTFLLAQLVPGSVAWVAVGTLLAALVSFGGVYYAKNRTPDQPPAVPGE